MLSRIIRIAVVLVPLCGFLLAADTGVWLDVPFVKQEKNGCGAASIAMVMQYWQHQQRHPAGEGYDAAAIQRALYSVKAHGIYASDLEWYFKENGFRTFTIRGEWEDLKDQLDKRRPLIVSLRPDGGGALHYVVVTGIDENQDIVMVNDPAQRKLLKVDRSSFERRWSATRKWTLLALPQAESR